MNYLYITKFMETFERLFYLDYEEGLVDDLFDDVVTEYRHLNFDDRLKIAKLYNDKNKSYSYRVIAELLFVSPSTISREIKRNELSINLVLIQKEGIKKAQEKATERMYKNIKTRDFRFFYE